MGTNMISRVLDTDIVIVGGSGAGVTAALAAHRAGRRAILISKGKIGKSGNVIMAGGAMSVDGQSAQDVMGLTGGADVTRDGWFDSIVKEGFYLSDQPVVEQFVYDGPPIVKEYVDWATRAKIPFRYNNAGKWSASGKDFGLALKEGMRDAPSVDVLEDVTALEVLTANGRAVGVLALDLYTGELLVIRGKAVVLGTGGYQPFSLKNSVTDMTGDGVGMAFRAGADIVDMEFLLSFPTATTPQCIRGSIYPYLLIVHFGMRGGIWPVIRDGHGQVVDIPEEVLQKTAFYKGSKLTKLICTYYWGAAIGQGRGTANDGIYLDYSHHSPEAREKGIEGFFSVVGPYYKKGHYKGDDLAPVINAVREGRGVEVGLGFEYSNGGILIDEKMRTTVPGLFAAGEVSSGAFGAMRVGDGLIEMVVQGYAAGESASAFAGEENAMQPDADLVEHLAAKCKEPLGRRNGISPIQVQTRIEQACDKGFGVRRNEKGLKATLDELLRIKAEDMPRMAAASPSPRYNLEWLAALQMENLMVCVESGVRAAIERKESRGNHIRDDFPEVNHDGWLVRQIVSPASTGGMTLRREKPRVTKIPLISGRDTSVMDFFLRPGLDYKRVQWGS